MYKRMPTLPCLSPGYHLQRLQQYVAAMSSTTEATSVVSAEHDPHHRTVRSMLCKVNLAMIEDECWSTQWDHVRMSVQLPHPSRLQPSRVSLSAVDGWKACELTLFT